MRNKPRKELRRKGGIKQGKNKERGIKKKRRIDKERN